MTILNTSTITLEELKKAETQDLVETYNQITGKEIKKFESRSKAESRTWAAIQSLAPGENAQKMTVEKEKEKAPSTSKVIKIQKEKKGRGMNFRFMPMAESKFKEPRNTSIRYQVFKLIDRENGATTTEIMEKLRTKTKLNLYEHLRLIHSQGGFGMWHTYGPTGVLRVRLIRSKDEYNQILNAEKQKENAA